MAPKTAANIGRLGEIAQVAVQHGFGSLLDERRGADCERRRRSRGRHLREMLDELGPTFVKFGQLLSTRPDIVPPDIIAELRGLQDDVRPFPFADVERVIREDLGAADRAALPRVRRRAARRRLDRAGAPGGAAERPPGRRQGAAPERAPPDRERHPAARAGGAARASERVRALDFIDTREIVDEFARSIRQELDYRQEARNAEAFHRNFAGHPHVAVPRVYWSYTRQRVLTLEYLDGVQLADLELDAWTIEQRRRLAYVIAETWLTMIFRHGFFHGDPHPANILVLAPDRIGLVDFGLAGKLTDRDLSKLTRALHRRRATRTSRRCRGGSPTSACATRRTSEEQFISELHTVYSRYYGSSLSEIDPLQLIREAFALIYSMNLRLPSRFVLLDKAIATVGSVGVDLYPDFNVFEVARPYARSLMLERFTPRRVAGRARREGVAARPDGLGASLPGLRDARAGPRRRDRVRLRAQGARRLHAQARRASRTGS